MDNTDISSTLFFLNKGNQGSPLTPPLCLYGYYVEEETNKNFGSPEETNRNVGSPEETNFEEEGLEGNLGSPEDDDSLFEWIDALIQYRDQCYTGELNDVEGYIGSPEEDEGEPRFPSNPGEPRFPSNPSSLSLGEPRFPSNPSSLSLGEPRFPSNPSSLFIGEEYDEDYIFEHKKELYCFQHRLYR